MAAKRTAKGPAKTAGKGAGEMVEVRTPNVPGYRGRVDAARYAAMLEVMRKVLPRKAPGLTQAEMFEAIRAAAPGFPGAHGWWAKSVQLDQEARGNLVREPTKPLRWHWA